MPTITINGRSCTIPDNASVEIIDNTLYVDGQPYEHGLKEIVTLVVVKGSLLELTTNSSVSCENIVGNVTADGSVTCKDVGGFVDAGGSVNAGNVNGDVNAGGSVKCNDVGGSINRK